MSMLSRVVALMLVCPLLLPLSSLLLLLLGGCGVTSNARVSWCHCEGFCGDTITAVCNERKAG